MIKKKCNQKIRLTYLLFGCFLLSTKLFGQQSEYEDTTIVEHTTATTKRPKYYTNVIRPRQGYYIAHFTEKKGNQPTCGWCYPSYKLDRYGFGASYSIKCDGGPCKISYIAVCRSFYVDTSIIKITKDADENLSSTYWVENRGGKDLELIYKVESYDPSSSKYVVNYASLRVPAFDRVRAHPRYKRQDNRLYEDFFSAVYTK